MQEYDNSATTPAVEYIRGSDYGGGVGGILYTLRSGSPSFKHYNSRGDVVAATDGTGTLTYQAAYEAFGKHGGTASSQEYISAGATLDRQRANTKDEDPTGLLNEGFRYRDLETGTFLTRDPLGFVDGPNVYTYVRQNPWTKFDPLGLYPNGAAAKAALDTFAKSPVPPPVKAVVAAGAGGYMVGTGINHAPRLFGGEPLSETLGGWIAGMMGYDYEYLPPLSVDQMSQIASQSGSSNARPQPVVKPAERGFNIENDADQAAWNNYLAEKETNPGLAEANLRNYESSRNQGKAASSSASVNWTDYNGKHVANKNTPWKKQVEATKSGPAKYSPGTDIESLERDVWENGQSVTNGKNWKVQEFDHEIGASGGKSSRWIRVENNSGTIHGHPITQQEYQKLTKKQESD